MQKTKLLTLFVALLFFSEFSAQYKSEGKESLNGNVKYVRHNSTTYHSQDIRSWQIINKILEYNRLGFPTKSMTFHNNDSLDYYHSHNAVYSQNGDRCLEKYFVLNGDTNYSCIYKYDEFGSPITQAIDDRIYSCSNCQYYIQDTISIQKCIYIDDKDTTWDIYAFNSFHQKTMYKTLSEDYSSITTWCYDANHNLIEERVELITAPPIVYFKMSGDGSFKEKKNTESDTDDPRAYILNYTYNDKNQKVTEIKKQFSGRIIYEITYEYNSNGEVQLEKHSEIPYYYQEIFVVNFAYDHHGNWIEKNTYKDNLLFIEETRQILYYD